MFEPLLPTNRYMIMMQKTGSAEIVTTIKLTIERNGTGTVGSGTLIYTKVFNTGGDASISPLNYYRRFPASRRRECRSNQI